MAVVAEHRDAAQMPVKHAPFAHVTLPESRQNSWPSPRQLTGSIGLLPWIGSSCAHLAVGIE